MIIISKIENNLLISYNQKGRPLKNNTILVHFKKKV